MTPQENDYVEVRFTDGTAIRGFVASWSDSKSVIKAENNESFILINRTLKTVLAVRIFVEHPEQIKQRKAIEEKQKFIKYNDLLEEEKTQDYNKERMQSLLKLKAELNEMEKQNIKDDLTSQKSLENYPVQYDYPNLNKIAIPVKHSSAKSTGQTNRFDKELSNLFRKKD